MSHSTRIDEPRARKAGLPAASDTRGCGRDHNFGSRAENVVGLVRRIRADIDGSRVL